MKKIIVLLFVLLLAAETRADTFLKWDAVISPNSEKPVLGYIVYFWNESAPDIVYNFDAGDVLLYNISIGNLNLSRGAEYGFYVTVYNIDGQSPPSNLVNWTNPAFSPPINKLPPTSTAGPDSSNLTLEEGR